MNTHDIFQQLSRPQILQSINSELQHRRTSLVQLAEEGRILDSTDRDNILRYLRDKQLPGRPITIEEVMKNFASSALSYHIIRRSLGSHIGAIPTASSIAKALAVEFMETRFLDDTFWNPASMKTLALDVASNRGLTNAMLGDKTLHSRILGVLHDGAHQLGIALTNGLDAYYADIEQHLTSPESAWEMLERFTAEIRQVGAPLTADFMKNIGFHIFVKPDFHFLRQLPQLTGLNASFSPRNAFVLGWLLAPALKIYAFELDHTLYQWGRHGEKSEKVSARKAAASPTSAKHSQSEQPFSKVVGSSSPSEQILEYLQKTWQDEPTRNLSIHRQEQLLKILSKYDGRSLPISHFKREHQRRSKLRNEDAYPAVKALLCGILERTSDSLRLKEGIVLGKEVLP